MTVSPSPLKSFRVSHTPKLTLKDLSEQIGVTEGQVSRIERFGTTSAKMALKLAEVTGLPADVFVRSDAA